MENSSDRCLLPVNNRRFRACYQVERRSMSDTDISRQADDERLIDRASGGDGVALAELFDRYRKRLRQMVRLRLDRRLQGRVDPSDVLQEAYLDVAQQLPHYLCKREMPFFLWLRLVAGQRLMRIHREHLGAAMRDAGREVSLYKGALPQASSVSLAAQLLGRYTPASQSVSRAEVQIQIQTALNGMEPIDREIIALRHFEELTNAEVAEVLGVEISTASKRYIRALKRLQVLLEQVPGLLDRMH
jgi:RNA polymerase sigma-70 factor, ECF subfamily